ncbi:MAG: ADP-glyceromanno-heptose 6-epimerase [Deltaproteobacteria bacterium RIFCSPHIGHO2_02_FULL_40_11]|nr:MAG: ADP-glyceromanno-heptose 6-epimerase [Deltaproteobacteria bacterium RIFCSPHIGHO2_02_FULL_40_11]
MLSKEQILVTGAAGFIGARFVEAALSNHHVISVDKASYFKERREHARIPFQTIVDRDDLFTWLTKNQPKLSAIIHLGACTDTTEMDVDYLTQINLEYTKKIWAYAAKHQTPLVYASSAATYGEGELGYDDNEDLIPKLKPLNPYGRSKQDFDLWALDQEKKGNHPPTWSGFKFFNVYGFGERHKNNMSSVILKSFDQIRAKGFVRLFKSHRAGISDGEQQRDFVFVGDVIDVLNFAYQKPIQRGIYNLGTGQARSFLDLVRGVFHALGKKENVEFIDTPIEIRDKYQYFTEARMENLKQQGYTKSFTSLEAGIEQYVAELLKNVG